MIRAFRSVAAATTMTAALTLAATGSALAASSAVKAVSGSRAPAARASADVGALAASRRLSVQVWLAGDTAAAARFVNGVSTPGSAFYHRYLSPKQYTARFGATPAQARAVSSWLRSQGLSKVKVSAQRDYVSATAPVSKIEHAFAVHMRRYRVIQNGHSSVIDANDRNVKLPVSLSKDVLSITGLDSVRPSTDHTKPLNTAAASSGCSQYWAQHVSAVTPAIGSLTKSPNLNCGYSAAQLREAYGQTNANTGAGQTIALIEVGQPTEMYQTLTDYADANHLPAPSSSQFRQELIGNGGSCGNPFDVEEQLDSEAAYAMAPGAKQLMVDGDSCDEALEGVQSLFNADLAVLNGNGQNPSASIVSNSWGFGGENAPSIYAKTAHSIDLRAAAEGVGMYFASGDDPGVALPASDPYSTAVGGTTLGVGATGNRVFETGWSDDYREQDNPGSWSDDGIGGAAGGGASLLYPQPSYQKGIVPSSMSTTSAGQVDRAVPDISADADPFSGMLVGTIEMTNGKPGPYTTESVGGTSLASPLVAGIVADAQQGQSSSFGFINPLLYSLASSGAYNDATPQDTSTPQLDRSAFVPASLDDGVPLLGIFDDQNQTQTDQVTANGYDTTSGLGTPNGTTFLQGLRAGR